MTVKFRWALETRRSLYVRAETILIEDMLPSLARNFNRYLYPIQLWNTESVGNLIYSAGSGSVAASVGSLVCPVSRNRGGDWQRNEDETIGAARNSHGVTVKLSRRAGTIRRVGLVAIGSQGFRRNGHAARLAGTGRGALRLRELEDQAADH